MGKSRQAGVRPMMHTSGANGLSGQSSRQRGGVSCQERSPGSRTVLHSAASLPLSHYALAIRQPGCARRRNLHMQPACQLRDNPPDLRRCGTAGLSGASRDVLRDAAHRFCGVSSRRKMSIFAHFITRSCTLFRRPRCIVTPAVADAEAEVPGTAGMRRYCAEPQSQPTFVVPGGHIRQGYRAARGSSWGASWL